ncbi:MAG: CCA tRNA nucleotidyltransferase, partial [Sulfurimonas sp.]|nr:CCA tRNA nucleotidyltransferase [Sulfurimonas sp.]
YEKLEDILKEFGKVNSVGKSFGVCKLSLDDLDLDFSLPRIDSKISVGHRGFNIKIESDIDFITATSRRDFTINSIGYDIKNQKILDPYNGVQDLKNKTLKIVDKKTFAEDPLRLLRAMQFCARFELRCDKTLISICQEMIINNMLNELSKERIYEEFKKLFLKAQRQSIGLNFLNKINGLDYFNELQMNSKLWTKTLNSIDNFSANKTDNNKTNITISLALLCYEINKDKTKSFLDKLIGRENLFKNIYSFQHIARYIQNRDDKLLYTIAKDIDTKGLALFLQALNICNKTMNKIKPIIHGKDILTCGIQPSKEFSDILNYTYKAQIDKKFKNKKEALTWLKNYLRS